MWRTFRSRLLWTGSERTRSSSRGRRKPGNQLRLAGSFASPLDKHIKTYILLSRKGNHYSLLFPLKLASIVLFVILSTRSVVVQTAGSAHTQSEAQRLGSWRRLPLPVAPRPEHSPSCQGRHRSKQAQRVSPRNESTPCLSWTPNLHTPFLHHHLNVTSTVNIRGIPSNTHLSPMCQPSNDARHDKQHREEIHRESCKPSHQRAPASHTIDTHPSHGR